MNVTHRGSLLLQGQTDKEIENLSLRAGGCRAHSNGGASVSDHRASSRPWCDSHNVVTAKHVAKRLSQELGTFGRLILQKQQHEAVGEVD